MCLGPLGRVGGGHDLAAGVPEHRLGLPPVGSRRADRPPGLDRPRLREGTLMTLLHPVWLALAIPLGVSLWLWRFPSRLLLALRVAVLLLLLLGMCGLAVYLPARAGTVVVVADRSRSMPP